jgi:hypothetical protein
MPSPAEKPRGSRPWWREPLPPEDSQPDPQAIAPAAAPGSAGAAGSAPPATPPAAPPGAASIGTGGPRPVTPPPWEAADGSPARTGAGPDDATVVMESVQDVTQVLPPVPPDPSGFAPSPASRPGPVPMTAPSATTGPASPTGRRVGGQPGTGPAAPAVDLDAPAGVPSEPSDQQGTGGPRGAGDSRGAGGRRAAAARLLQRLSPATGAPRDRRSTLVTAGGAALALLLVLAGAGLLVSRLRNQTPTRGIGRTATAIDLSTVHGSASSVQRPDGGITYTVGNTLDGDPATAWNSDGAHDGRGPGITLTYKFTLPVDLSAVTIRNGYQKVRPNGIDLWERNERVKQLEIVTDTGQWTWDLKDVRDPQTLEQRFGRTRTVRLKIVQIYPSTKYPDVAISEIAFTGIPAS